MGNVLTARYGDPMESATSLRERKKAATRLALHRAVVELAAAKGLDAVTVDAVADHANVSRRTFSNYFANKEEALLYGERTRYERLLAALRARPDTETPWQALTRSVGVLVDAIAELDPVWIAQMRVVRRHPSLAAHQMALQCAVESDFVTEVLKRLQRQQGSNDPVADTLRARVVAGTFLAAMRAAVAVWINQQETLSLPELVETALRTAGDRIH
jgi:AcrR family transcriptional regulator